MEPGAILLFLSTLVFIFVFMAQLFTNHWRIKDQRAYEFSILLVNRENVLNDQRELDFEFKFGKVPLEEYSAQLSSPVPVDAGVLRQREKIQSLPIASTEEPVKPMALVKTIIPLADEDLEDLIAKRRAARQQKAAGFCTKCGKPIQQSDRFCSSCGQAINPR